MTPEQIKDKLTALKAEQELLIRLRKNIFPISQFIDEEYTRIEDELSGIKFE